MPQVSKSVVSLAVSMLLSFSTSALAAGDQAAASPKKNLTLQKPAPNKAQMKKDASAAAKAYYAALIAGDYKRAGFFVHKDLADGLRAELNRQLQTPKAAQKRDLLKHMKVSSPAELSTLTDAVLFARWAQSPMGFKIGVMANPKAEAKADIENVYCYPKTNHCDIAMMLRANNQGGKVNTNRFLVRAEPDGGRWKLGATTAQGKKMVPVLPVKQR